MPARSLITTVSFLLWFSLALASASGDVVNDRNGHPLVPGQEYFITAPIRGPIGPGVALEKTGNASSCEYSIIREPFSGGAMRVKFHVVGRITDKIYLGSTFLKIEFVEKPDCSESSKWAAAASDSPSSSLFRLVIGDSASVSGFFQIQNHYAFGYKLVFCPGSVLVVPPTCFDIGLETNGNLVVRHDDTGNSAEQWWFVKAQSVKGKFSII